ncbi:MAG: potassium channel protein [Lachnospiraceae bacterium]|nr:potassium channel protein [Lachnospiraceae bacterium]
MLAVNKRRTFEIIQIGNDQDWPSRLFDMLVIIMILTNLFIAIFTTFDQAEPYLELLNLAELITVIGFTTEYALRVWTAEFLYPAIPPRQAAVRYMTSFSGVIDLLSFFPYFLPIFFPTGVVAFRMFRIIRIFRLFRVNAYYDALNVIGDVIRGKRDQILSSVFIILVLMISSSLIMYSLENEVQPQVFQNAFSGFWWAVSTLLTVGYGDIYPITIAGRIFGIIITFLGVGMVAIPTGILSAGFVEQYTRLKTFNDYSLEADIRFVRLEVEEGHPWLNRRVMDLPLPPGLLIAVIQRAGDVVVPRGDIVIEKGDHIVLGAEGYQDEVGIRLKELILKERHPWVGQKIKDLDISRQTLIVMVRRDGKLLIPGGDLELMGGDMILLYTKKVIRDAVEVDV